MSRLTEQKKDTLKLTEEKLLLSIYELLIENKISKKLHCMYQLGEISSCQESRGRENHPIASTSLGNASSITLCVFYAKLILEHTVIYRLYK